jgi:hypothetical protein
MKDYSLYPIKEGGVSLWVVKETTTEQVIEKFAFKDDAVAKMKFLNRGGAFAGFTPSFMVKQVPVPGSVDEAFEIEFSRA